MYICLVLLRELVIFIAWNHSYFRALESDLVTMKSLQLICGYLFGLIDVICGVTE